uniref:Mov34/MPN/PAD-1 family protein n=1 Tax=uncultured marine thaumarchaeote KM3_67_A04 TaxID=1456230 RepID=A0A075HGI0_9ARCH|nr:Mov34/MPN/PAD-1 family protein [uncultured marine thaumarchaeote KM3_67_A04]
MNLFSKKKKFERRVSLKQETRDGILSYCKMSHPDEGILILRGKSEHGNVLIDALVIPPFSETGADFAGFPHNPLPLDPSYVGIVHSHPVGSAEPSLTDLNNFFGLVSIIVKSPYEDEDVFAWDSSGNEIPLDIV